MDYTVTHVYIKIEHYKQKTVIKCLAKEIHYEKSIKSLIMITRSVKREGYLLATRSQYRTTIRYPSRGLHTKLLIKYNVSHALTHDRSRYDGVSKEQIFITLTNVSARSFLLIPEFLRAPVASRRNHSMLTRWSWDTFSLFECYHPKDLGRKWSRLTNKCPSLALREYCYDGSSLY